MKFFVLIFLCLTTHLVFTQKAIESADYYYERKAYAKAIELFEPIFSSNPSQEVALKLADACYRIRLVNKAADYYQKASLIKPLSEENAIKYFEVLRETGQLNLARGYAKENIPQKSNRLNVIFDSIRVWNSQQNYKIENLNLNTQYNEFGVSYFQGNELIFNSDRPDQNSSTQSSLTNNMNFLEMFILRIEDSMESYPILKKFNSKTSRFHDGTSYYDNVNKKLYFTRNYSNSNRLIGNRAKVSNLQILIADVDTGYHLKNIKEFKYNDPDYSVGHPCLSNDGNYLYFVSDMPSSKGGTDIYFCEKMSDGDWGFPVNLGVEINTIGNEMFPSISPSNELIFSSNGHIGFGGLDLFRSTSLKGGRYGRPVNMGSVLNSNSDDFALLYSDFHQTKGYFSSNRKGGKGGDDIYRFFRTNIKSNCNHKDFRIAVVDNKSREALSGAEIVMVDLVNADTIIGKTNHEGECLLKVCANKDYSLCVRRPNYLINIFNDIDLTKDNYAVKLIKKEINTSIELKNIYYEFDKADIHPLATAQLDLIANLLIQNPDIKVELSSHTDSRGKDEYNMALSQKRAENVVMYLQFMGVEASRMIAKGYGESRLLNNCVNGMNCLEEEHVQNRRTEFRIVDILNLNSIFSRRDPSQAIRLAEASSKGGFSMNSINNINLSSLDNLSPQVTRSRVKLNTVNEERLYPEELNPTERSQFASKMHELAKIPVSQVKAEKTEDIIDPDNVKQPSYNTSIKKGTKKLNSIEQMASYYSIQLGAFSAPSDLKSFAQFNQVHLIIDNSKYLVLSGKFDNLQAAERYKPIVKKVIPNAFLVRIVDGKKSVLR